MNKDLQNVIDNLSTLKGFENLSKSVSFLESKSFQEENFVFKNTGNFVVSFKNPTSKVAIFVKKGVLRFEINTSKKGCSCPLQNVNLENTYSKYCPN